MSCLSRRRGRACGRGFFARAYQQVVVEPALLFISSFAPHLAKLSPFFVADPRPTRGSLFQIYRDTRFSPDKRPFSTLFLANYLRLLCRRSWRRKSNNSGLKKTV